MISEDALCRLSDEEVVLLAQAGNDDALGHIIARYRNLVYARANTYFLVGAEKEDVAQEGLIGLYKAVKEFDPLREGSFKSFAGLCISHQIITAIKAATRKKHIPLNSYISLDQSKDDDSADDVPAVLEDTEQNPEAIILEREALANIERKINKALSKMEMQVFIYYIDGLSYEEIALLLDKPVKSVDNALCRIKKKLADELK